MTYVWGSWNDQDKKVHKRCYMGTIMLSVVEAGFTTSDQLIMQGVAAQWMEDIKEWMLIYESKVQFLGVQKAKEHMEDWYYEYHCFDKDFLG